jgi:hypothetical protein
MVKFLIIYLSDLTILMFGMLLLLGLYVQNNKVYLKLYHFTCFKFQFRTNQFQYSLSINLFFLDLSNTHI